MLRARGTSRAAASLTTAVPTIVTPLVPRQGAIVSVLRCPSGRSTAGTHFTKTAARISVRTRLKEKPTEEQLAAVVDAANKVVSEGRPLCRFDMPRAEAEERYGGLMYDSYRVPEDATVLPVRTVRRWHAPCWQRPCVAAVPPRRGTAGRRVQLATHRGRVGVWACGALVVVTCMLAVPASTPRAHWRRVVVVMLLLLAPDAVHPRVESEPNLGAVRRQRRLGWPHRSDEGACHSAA